VTSAMVGVLVLLNLFEAIYLYLGRLHQVRVEAAYWHARDHRPPLYDWARELDL
jgi:hypothetical protein